MASSGIVIRSDTIWVSLKVDREALVVQDLTGQDQVFGFLSDAPDAAGPWFAPHGDEGERLVADAHVLLVELSSSVGTHCLHLLQVTRMEEGLRGSVTAPVGPDVLLPFILIDSGWGSRADVTVHELVEAVVPLGKLARSIIFGKCVVSHQETQDDRENSPQSSHDPRSTILDWTGLDLF